MVGARGDEGRAIKINMYDIIIIGAGASGLSCAIEAGKISKKILVLDHAKVAGTKIRLSGGGRCNFTNINTTPDNYLSNNKHFCISALQRYTPADFIKRIEKNEIAYHEKTLGQLFCDDSSKQIIDMLLNECKSKGVEIALNSTISNIEKIKSGFEIFLSNGEKYTTKKLVIATGGLSLPKQNATGFGYEIAKKFGINVIAPQAALVPFTLNKKTLEKLKILSGISLPVIISCNKKSFEESLLFTHRGLSGPAILQISSYWKKGDFININLAPYVNVLEKFKTSKKNNPKQEIKTAIIEILPKRLVKYICDEYNYQGRIANLSNKYLEKIANTICNWTVYPNGTEGFATAEVTTGGIDTNELSSKTFEAKKVSGLYFIGEVIDVTGQLGGYNFQWAWASGYCAGLAPYKNV